MLRLRRGCLQRLSRELKLLRGNVRLTANTLPFIREIHSFGGYNSEQRSFRGEDGDNVCSAFELSVIAPAIKEYCLDSTTNWNLRGRNFVEARDFSPD